MVMGLKLVIKIPVKNMNVISTSATSLMNYLHLFIIIFHKSSLIYLVLHFLGIHTNVSLHVRSKDVGKKLQINNLLN